MTSENKPSWQYVPPAPPTNNDVIDATRFMKGSSRKSEPSSSNVSSAPATAENSISAQPVDASSSKKSSSPEETPVSNPEGSSQEDRSRQIEYASENAPRATEYSASSEDRVSRERPGRENRRYDSRREYRRKDGEFRKESCGCSHSSQKGPETPPKGILASIGSFFKSLFGCKKPEKSPETSYSGERRYDRSGYREGGPRGDFRRGGRRRFRGGRGGGGPRRSPRPPQA